MISLKYVLDVPPKPTIGPKPTVAAKPTTVTRVGTPPPTIRVPPSPATRTTPPPPPVAAGRPSLPHAPSVEMPLVVATTEDAAVGTL